MAILVKFLIDVGGASIVTTIRGVDISGAQGHGGTVAVIRYKGSQFTLDQSISHGNQPGLYGVADKNGIATIENSTFSGTPTTCSPPSSRPTWPDCPAGLSSQAQTTRHTASTASASIGSATILVASMNQHDPMQLISRG